MNKINTVLVGIGGFGRNYVNECFFGKSAELVNVCAVVEPYLDGASTKDVIEANKVPAFDTLETFFLSGISAELAVISSPIGYHADQIVFCLNNGCNVLCEKPLCADEKDIERIAQAERINNKHVCVGYQWSTSKAIQDAKQDIMNGVYGKPKLLKTLVLWPRSLKYFNRSTGWAGRISDDNGNLIYDSIANNACSHHLHNMFFMLGKSMSTSMSPLSISANLLRANKIENFDTAIIDCDFADGATGHFIASHSVFRTIEPVFSYQFENGRIVLVNNDANSPDENKCSKVQSGSLIGLLNDGRFIDYGIPDISSNCKKLQVFIQSIKGEKNYYCTTDGASVQTRVINYIQNNYKIIPAPNVSIDNDTAVSVGLDDVLCKIYNNPQNKQDLKAFINGDN